MTGIGMIGKDMNRGRNGGMGGSRYAARVLFALSLALSLLVAACGGSAEQNQSQGQGQEKRYHMAGTVVSIDKEQQHLVVNHGEIPGFMSAMTMPYPVADPATLERV